MAKIRINFIQLKLELILKTNKKINNFLLINILLSLSIHFYNFHLLLLK